MVPKLRDLSHLSTSVLFNRCRYQLLGNMLSDRVREFNDKVTMVGTIRLCKPTGICDTNWWKMLGSGYRLYDMCMRRSRVIFA